MPLWLRPEEDPVSVAVVEPGREFTVPAQGRTPRWTLDFGPPGQPHRLLRFTRLNTTRAGKAAT
jgi:hypothetical protein